MRGVGGATSRVTPARQSQHFVTRDRDAADGAAGADAEENCWVMVNGIETSEDAEAAREQLLSQVGMVEELVEGEGNWIYIRFSTLSQKESAIQQSRDAQLVCTVRGAQKMIAVFNFTREQQREKNFRARDRDRSHVPRVHDSAATSGRLRAWTPSRRARSGGRQRRFVNGQMVVDDIADGWLEQHEDEVNDDGLSGGAVGGSMRRRRRGIDGDGGHSNDMYAVRHRGGFCEKLVQLCAALCG
jgi:hypothetical protein